MNAVHADWNVGGRQPRPPGINAKLLKISPDEYRFLIDEMSLVSMSYIILIALKFSEEIAAEIIHAAFSMLNIGPNTLRDQRNLKHANNNENLTDLSNI